MNSHFLFTERNRFAIRKRIKKNEINNIEFGKRLYLFYILKFFMNIFESK